MVRISSYSGIPSQSRSQCFQLLVLSCRSYRILFRLLISHQCCYLLNRRKHLFSLCLPYKQEIFSKDHLSMQKQGHNHSFLPELAGSQSSFLKTIHSFRPVLSACNVHFHEYRLLQHTSLRFHMSHHNTLEDRLLRS